MAPAERTDMIVEFRGAAAGVTYILFNDAPAPYPGGDPLNDYFTGNTTNGSGAAGSGPNTRTLLQIVIQAQTGSGEIYIIGGRRALSCAARFSFSLTVSRPLPCFEGRFPGR